MGEQSQKDTNCTYITDMLSTVAQRVMISRTHSSLEDLSTAIWHKNHITFESLNLFRFCYFFSQSTQLNLLHPSPHHFSISVQFFQLISQFAWSLWINCTKRFLLNQHFTGPWLSESSWGLNLHSVMCENRSIFDCSLSEFRVFVTGKPRGHVLCGHYLKITAYFHLCNL